MKRIMYKYVFKGVLLALFAVCVFMLTGCEDRPASDTATVPVPEKSPYINCFGTIVARETYPVYFPFSLEISKVEVRNGQAVSADDVLFHVDYESLLKEQTIIHQELSSRQFRKSGYEEDLSKLKQELAACTLGVKEFKAEEMMDLLKAIAANKTSTAKFNKSRLTLIKSLDRFGLIQYYQDLLNCAISRDKFYYEQANPLLMQIDSQFDSKLPELAAQLDEKSAQLNQIENEIILAQAKADTINAFLSGQTCRHVKLSKNGNVCLADSGFLVDTINISQNTTAPADQPVIEMMLTDSLEAVCLVEEQLVKGIRPGDRAQLSLYTDNTAVALGTVSFVSQKAVEVNGETVVEVVISYDNSIYLPGYNIVAKISSESPE
jgi:multidrug resistance efflux pump